MATESDLVGILFLALAAAAVVTTIVFVIRLALFNYRHIRSPEADGVRLAVAALVLLGPYAIVMWARNRNR